jgi:hypothetical protein
MSTFEDFVHDAAGVPGIAGFSIDLLMPATLTADIGGDLHLDKPGKWVIHAVDLTRREEAGYRLQVAFDLTTRRPIETDRDELIAFRDLIVSLISLTLVAPVRTLSKGIFIFQRGPKEFSHLSLGPSNIDFPFPPLPTAAAIASGAKLEGFERTACYLFWQAMNSDEPSTRFMNLVMCLELVVSHSSTVPRSVNPHCANPSCSYVLTNCPQCTRDWTIPNALRSRARAVFREDDLVRQCLQWRNKLLHGSYTSFRKSELEELHDLNVRMSIMLRNHLGEFVQLPPIDSLVVPVAFAPPDVEMTVYYTVP